MKTLDQIMAERVYERVNDYAQQYPLDSPERKRYGVMAQKLPVLVRSAGLAQALAFVGAKATNQEAYQRLLTDIAYAVMEQDTADSELLMQLSRSAELPQYIHLTQKTMLALTWFKRFSQSLLKVEPTDTED